MENYKFRQLLLDTASNYDGMSQELFKLAHAPFDLFMMEDDQDTASDGSSRVMHQVKPATAAPVASAPAAPAPTPAPVKPDKPLTLDDLLNTMSLDDAKNVVVDIGRYSGSTLGQIVMSNPHDLEWYVKYYAGKNLALKAGAILLMNAATAKAS